MEVVWRWYLELGYGAGTKYDRCFDTWKALTNGSYQQWRTDCVDSWSSEFHRYAQTQHHLGQSWLQEHAPTGECPGPTTIGALERRLAARYEQDSIESW